MADPVEKLSISVPASLVRSVRKRVGPRGMSGFVTHAMALALEQEELGTYLEALDAELGPVPPATLRAVKRAWAKR